MKNSELLNTTFIAEELQGDWVMLSVDSSSGSNTRRILSSFRFAQRASLVKLFSKNHLRFCNFKIIKFRIIIY